MDDTWIQYHATRLNLIQSIETHLKSVAAFNVYNNGSRKDIPLNTSGDYNLTNELMGYDLMNELRSSGKDSVRFKPLEYLCEDLDVNQLEEINKKEVA
jgi:hypothetical protein